MKKYLIFFSLLLICLSSAGCSDAKKKPGGVDVDLTELSGTMAYAEILNILTKPEDYFGKTIKIAGPYAEAYYDVTDLYYHYVVVEDITACCAQGLEFILAGEYEYPGDFPEEKTKIEITGVFGSYIELDRTYYCLTTDEIKVLN